MSVEAVDARRPPGNTPRYQPLVIVLTATATGILADRFWPLSLAAWWGIAASGLVVWLALWRCGRTAIAAATLLLTVGTAAAAWHHCCWYLFAEDDLGHFTRAARQPVCIDLVALKTPRQIASPAPNPMRVMQNGDQVRLDVELLGIRDGACWRSASGRSRMVVEGLLPDVRAGDRLRVFAQLAMPSPPMNPGEFDAASHLRGSRARCQLRADFAESVSLLETGSAWSPRRLLEQIRMHGNRLFGQYLSERHAALASAVLLGIREQIDPESTEAFMETGTVHLLVIAGLHLGILAGAVLLVLRRMPVPRGGALLGTALFTLLYMLLVDAEPPVVRATVLVVTSCGAVYFGRRRPGFNVLAAAGLIVLAFNPADLFRTGAQLSFLCVAGLMLLAPFWMHTSHEHDPIERLLAENRSWPARWSRALGRTCWRLTLVSAAIWLTTLPLVMARFHLFTPVTVLINTMVLLPMNLALISGLGLLVLGTLCPPAAPLCSVACNGSLAVLDWMVGLGQRCPGGHFWVPGPADWWLVGFYGGLGLLTAFPRIRPPRRWCVALLAGWIAVGFVAGWPWSHPHRLQCTFLSVGHGEAIVLELPSGQTLLYDVGQFSAPQGATRAVSGFLWSRGITHLDAVVLSHGDVDHYNGLPGLLDRFSVGAIYVTPVMRENRNRAMRALWEAIEHSGVPIRETSAGERLAAGPDCTLEVLHPPRRGVLGRDNANSLVLSVEYLGHRILLTGDIEPPGLNDLLAETPTHCDVLLVPHHGSMTSSPRELAAWSTPGWAILSATHRWDLRPVTSIYERVGSRVLHTADTGAITVLFDAGGVKVEGIREGRD